MAGECVVCFEPFAESDKSLKVVTPWRCNHAFHEACVGPWVLANNSCPTCRCTETVPPPTQHTSPLFARHQTGVVIHQLGRVDFPVTLERYMWDDARCRETPHRRHIVTWTKPYGVIGHCSCGVVQTFNYYG